MNGIGRRFGRHARDATLLVLVLYALEESKCEVRAREASTNSAARSQSQVHR
jgi:hypothetical protein